MFQREIDKLEKAIGGIKDMNALPDALFVIDVGYHKIAVTEAKKLGIPIIGVVDTNHSPDGIDYVIPGNDDSSKAVALYARGVADAVLEGKANADQRSGAGRADAGDEFVEVDEGAAGLIAARRAASDQGLVSPFFTSEHRGAAMRRRRLTRPNGEARHGGNHRKHGRRTARQDRRADDGMQEGADRSRRRHGQGRGAAARQARQQGRQGRVAHHRRRRGRARSSTATTGALVEVNCETDFVAKNDDFLAFANGARRARRREQPGRRRRAGRAAVRSGRLRPTRRGRAQGRWSARSARTCRSAASSASPATASSRRYLHGTRIGVLVEYRGRRSARQGRRDAHRGDEAGGAVAASDVPADADREGALDRAQAAKTRRRSRASRRRRDRRQDGRRRGAEVPGGSHAAQPAVRQERQADRRADAQGAGRPRSSGFALYVVGEGIEKKVDDFAAEVAAQVAAAKGA